MILLTGLFITGNAARDAELRLCLKKNISNRALKAFWTFQEQPFNATVAKQLEGLDEIPDHVNYGAVGFAHRTTFKEYFTWANESLPAGELVCIANADIFFDETISLIKPQHLDNVFMCLSRWVYSPEGKHTLDKQAAGGNDAWIFKTPVKVPKDSNFTQGIIACDNKIARLMQLDGYKLENPCPQVRAIHVHASGHRTYGWDTTLLYSDVVSGVPITELKP